MTYKNVVPIFNVYQLRQKVKRVPKTLSKQKLELINQSFLFLNVDEIIVRRIIFDSGCVRKKYSRGEVISENEASEGALGIVLSGAIRVERMTSEGVGTQLQMLRDSECFGAAAVFSPKNNVTLRLVAERQTEVFFIPYKTLKWAIERSNAIMENYIRYLSDIIWMLQGRIFTLSAGTAEMRLAVYIADHCGPECEISGSMTEISRQLNLGRASLYRAIDKLKAENLIEQSGKTILVKNPDALHTFIDRAIHT